MVKLSNKGKGKPSKRKTLKTKYKIDRKVRQHKKKLRKEMRKLGSKNIKPRKGDKNNTLPNSFPFKAQILQHYKNQQPAQASALNKKLQPAEWGLIALENRSVYLPKDKDHLTKKYINNYDKIWENANVIIETADARNVDLCLSSKITEETSKRNIYHIVVVTKIDTVPEKKLAIIKKSLQQSGRKYCLFTTDQKRRNSMLEQLVKNLTQLSDTPKKCIVVGKSNTGKHTLVKQFMKLAKFHNEDYSTINCVDISANLSIIDTPYKVEDTTLYPLFWMPSSTSSQSVALQEQRALKYLFIDNLKDRADFIMHYGIQDYSSLDDMIKKVGKVNRMFGKGGMINVSEVRTKILTDWYQGKLNYIFA